MDITILGGGNVGSLMAAECARKGHSVTLCTSRPGDWKDGVAVYDRNDTFLFAARLHAVTDDLARAVRTAELIFITHPAETFPALAQKLLPLLRPEQALGCVPGSGGAEFAFRPFLQAGGCLFGFQRVHSIARVRERGHSVFMLGRKAALQLAAIPGERAPGLSRTMEALFDMPCRVLPNYLAVTLTPSNPILHTARLYSLFRDYQGKAYPRNFLFYEEWDDEASAMLLRCDDELQRLCAAIPLDLREVRSLRAHYESATVPEMTQKIRSIAAFRGLLSPMREVAGGWEPDFSSRYFSTDFSYGLKVLLDACRLFGVEAPAMEQVWGWYEDAARPAASFDLRLSRDGFLRLYS